MSDDERMTPDRTAREGLEEALAGVLEVHQFAGVVNSRDGWAECKCGEQVPCQFAEEWRDGEKWTEAIRLHQAKALAPTVAALIEEAQERAALLASEAAHAEAMERVAGLERELHEALTTAVAAQRDRDELAERLAGVARDIERRRNEHWQEHLRLHPWADGSSCPKDYGKHDAYLDAANIVRAALHRGDSS